MEEGIPRGLGYNSRMTRRVTAALLLATATVACGRTDEPAAPPATPPARELDIHTFARPDEARVTHVALDLRADFDANVLAGRATLTLQRAPGASQVVLDTSKLAIERVTAPDGAALTFTLGEPDAILGQPLTIQLPPDVNDIIVAYRTSPDADALQWLAPSQTAGKKQPYLYSQGQAILTRTWIPTQDSPGIRQTYSARITVPAGLRAVMSAEHLTPDGVDTPDGRAFEFRLTQPVPPYLIALAVGDISFRSLGPRTGVFTEPSMLDAAASEFADLEKMVTAAEALLGPYRWGRYDLLVLPPSFPFGGMENPRLTFVTPTILAGDRSLVSLVAHELAHSWSGNLVTNATWRDFWLNEGMTTYVELRLMEALYGAERAAMLDVLARRTLNDEITRLGGVSSPETILHIDLAGRNPDDGMTSIPYEKGAALLRLLERTLGRTRFDAYLRSYFDRHAFQPITTATFLADLRTHLFAGDPALEERLRIEEWLYEPGLPDNVPVPQSDALQLVEQQAKAFAGGASAASVKAATWTTQEWQHFLASLPEQMTDAQLADLDRTFRLTERRNSEVLFDWLRIAIRHRYQPAMPALERFLTNQGRRKFLRPLYEDLMKTDWGKAEAQRIYDRARPLYHSVATGTLDPIVRGAP
jgi:aminopeptidase N